MLKRKRKRKRRRTEPKTTEKELNEYTSAEAQAREAAAAVAQHQSSRIEVIVVGQPTKRGCLLFLWGRSASMEVDGCGSAGWGGAAEHYRRADV